MTRSASTAGGRIDRHVAPPSSLVMTPAAPTVVADDREPRARRAWKSASPQQRNGSQDSPPSSDAISPSRGGRVSSRRSG